MNDSLKVLFVNHNIAPYEFSGTPLTTLNHAKGAKDAGIDVAILIPDSNIRDEIIKDYVDNIPVYKIIKLGHEEAFFGNVSKGILYNYIQCVDKLIREFNPKIVHVNDYVYMPSEMLNFFSMAGIKVVRNICCIEELCFRTAPVIYSGRSVSICPGPGNINRCVNCYFKAKGKVDDKESFIKMKFLEKFYKLNELYKYHISKVIFTSTEFEKYFRSFVSISNEKIAVIERGLKFTNNRKNNPIKINKNPIKFAFVGAVIPQKGVDILLRAIETLVYDNEVEFHFYGDNCYPDYYNWINDLSIKNGKIIKCHGAYKPNELNKITSLIDCAIVPSYFETYNRVIREMLWSGIPVISTDFFGSKIIVDGINGFRIPCGDSGALVARILKIVENPKSIEILSEGALNTPILNLASEVDDIISLYKELNEN